MAADGNKVDVDIHISADTKGGDETVRSMDMVEKKAKSTAETAAKSFKKAEQSVSRFGKILGSITKISFVAGSISSVVSLWESLYEKARKAKEEAAEFAKAQAKAADKERIDKLAESYRKLGEQIGEAAKARQRANELEDMRISEADKLEDDEAKLQKAQQIAALDPNDPAYEEKKKRIENAYDVAAAKRSVDRTRRDAETKERREYAEAEAKHGEATEKSFAAIEDKGQAEVMRVRARRAREKSTEDNEYDASGFWSNFFGQLKAIVTFDGKHLGTHRTEKGDEERKRLEEEAKRYEEQAKEFDKSAKAKEDEAAAIEAEATHHSKRAGVYGISAANTSVAQSAAEITGMQSTAAAEKAVSDKEKELSDAKKAIALLQQQKAELEAKRDAAQSRKDAANLAVYDAKGNAETADMSGNRRDRAAAGEALRAAEISAQNVNHEADKTINSVNTALNGIATKLKQFQHVVENFEKRTNAARAESVSGQ